MTDTSILSCDEDCVNIDTGIKKQMELVLAGEKSHC